MSEPTIPEDPEDREDREDREELAVKLGIECARVAIEELNRLGACEEELIHVPAVAMSVAQGVSAAFCAQHDAITADLYTRLQAAEETARKSLAVCEEIDLCAATANDATLDDNPEMRRTLFRRIKAMAQSGIASDWKSREYEQMKARAEAAEERAATTMDLERQLAKVTEERDEWLADETRRIHGASGLCCQLRLQEKSRADSLRDLCGKLAEGIQDIQAIVLPEANHREFGIARITSALVRLAESLTEKP